jgi:DNA-binding XRE family transcriptional regulator
MTRLKSRPESILEKIIGEMKKMRLAKGLSHANLAIRTGITRPAVSHIENGKRKPSLLVALKIANALGKNLSDIVRLAEK